ncbi:hypothetical protein ACTFBT_03980 [Streptomyces microflavus]|uniref:Uncharacterized protein n=1 Tax=Streptomyces microflavus TaxID=1919 RepID=A0A7J0CJ61_STRMI|nr:MULTISPECIES: hypothetical protein [Streptomyces]WTC91383.1 hypothetical protein OH733_33670 [Streptomyces griseus]MDX2977615.1 hypothetical protein [Streptomyces sp. NRRL_B-2249]WSS38148.1 hypothetical protein OG269_33930 [Streptomyces microflavus]WST13134.1 hypothetical protein OG721_03715 [Streptomyces microflavus]WTD65985.1 hypothetical protein OH763_03325 [Streptomyces griseus]
MSLAALRADVAAWLVDSDPEVPMRANLQDFTDQVRAQVTEKIAAKLASAARLRSGCAGLLLPGLASQLAPMLGSDRPSWLRQEATLIIQATGLKNS